MTAPGYLLDTHVFIELAKLRGEPTGPLGHLLSDARFRIGLSVISVAEVCIKLKLGKLDLPLPIALDPARGIRAAAERAGFELLPLSYEQTVVLATLPLHHRDRFDRLLIATAIADDLVLISRDRAFADYQGLALLRP